MKELREDLETPLGAASISSTSRLNHLIVSLWRTNDADIENVLVQVQVRNGQVSLAEDEISSTRLAISCGRYPNHYSPATAVAQRIVAQILPAVQAFIDAHPGFMKKANRAVVRREIAQYRTAIAEAHNTIAFRERRIARLEEELRSLR